MKTIKLLAACCLTMYLFASCGGITVKGENGQEYESYQECCAAQDFMAAHTFLAKMEAKIDGDEIKKEEYETAKEYVFKQEALYLMSIGDDAAKQRIIYLLKEEGGNDSHVAMLIDLAIENDDEPFVKSLINQLRKDNGECVAKTIGYLAKKDDSEEFIEQLISKRLSLNNNKLINYLASTINKKHDEMIIGLVTAKQNEITKRPPNSFVDTMDDGGCEEYASSIKKYNALCQKVLGIAVSSKNLNLAQRAASLFRSNIHYTSTWIDGVGYKYSVTPDNEEVNEAKATLNSAIRSGAFK